ncbi:MAG: UDP-N-acetylmuramate dehydrogenase [Candidatus Gottesmanbacteria bacterium]|nr:UDP-N-acetylmuramate dehydrogenase [Candidatus Gottesmanbacteria bacterium]
MVGVNDLLKNEPLGKHTTFKIGGPADYFYNAKTVDDFVSAILLGRKRNLPIFILGGGTNILIGDRGIRGFVIKNSTNTITIKGIKGTVIAGEAHKGLVFVEADSGVIFNSLVRFTVEEGLAGLEMHLGLPGTVGGAIFMNSKWTHPPGYVGDAVYQAEIFTPENKRAIVPKAYFQFGYDTSSIQKTKDILLKVVFALRSDTKERLWAVANESIGYRRHSQPQGVFTAGCAFKNISQAEALVVPTPSHTTSAGFLIDHAGIKGEHVGDAYISDVHANFIINRGKATATDVVKLIERVRQKVKEQYGVILAEEIIRVGEF